MNDILSRLKCFEETRAFTPNEINRLKTDPTMYSGLMDYEYYNEVNNRDLDTKAQVAIDYAELYCLYLLEKNNRTVEESNYLIKIKEKLLQDLNNRNPAYVSSRLIRSSVVNKLFNADEIAAVKKYQSDVRAAFFTISEKIKTRQKCTPKELSIFFKFLIINLGTENEKIKEMIDFVVKDNIENKRDYSIFEKQFLICYLAYDKCKRKNLPMIKPYLTSIDLEGKRPTWGGLHIGFNSGSIVQINQKVAMLKDLVEREDHGLAHVVYHEYEHWNQCYNMKNNLLNPTTYIYSKSRLLRGALGERDNNGRVTYDEYISNYLFKETERFANIRAFRETGILVGKYFKNTVLEYRLHENATLLERQLERGAQYDRDGNIHYIGDYNIEKMEEVLKRNPGLLNSFPILRNFYNDDGSLKSFHDLISVYTKYSMARDYEALDTFEEVLEYKISHEETVDISKMNNEDVLSLLIILQDYLDKQIRSCKNILDSYGDPVIKRKEGESEETFNRRKYNIQRQIDLTNSIFRRKAKMIKTIMSFAYKNREFIEKYCSWNAERRFSGDKTARLTRFNSVFYGYNGIGTIDSRIESNPNVANSELIDDIRDISNYSPGR